MSLFTFADIAHDQTHHNMSKHKLFILILTFRPSACGCKRRCDPENKQHRIKHDLKFKPELMTTICLQQPPL